MRRRTLVLLAALIVHGGPSARADELLLGLDQMLAAQTNVFGLYEDEISDGIYELRPTLRLQRPEGKLSYDLGYSPIYEVFFRSDGLNGVNHFSRSTIGYEILPVASLTLHADIADYRATRAIDDPGGPPDVVPRTVGNINRIFVDLEYEHRLSRSTRAMGTVNFERYAFTIPNGVDNMGFGAEVEAIHQPISNFGVGVSLVGSLRRFEEYSLLLASQPASQNAVLNPNLVVELSPAPTLFLTLRVGPAVLFTRTDSPGIVGESSVNDEFVTGFLRAELQKEESWGRVRLSFQRDEDAWAVSGSTTIRDSATAELFVHSGERWTGHLLANWSQHKSKGSIVDRDVDEWVPFKTTITQYWLDLHVARKLSDRLQLGFMLRYLWQEREDSLVSVDRSFDNVIGRVMLRYSFAPFEYWVN